MCRISERDIDRLELLDWQRASLSELVTTAKRAVAGGMSLTEEDLCDSDLSGDDTISQGASTPLARSEGSPYDTDSDSIRRWGTWGGVDSIRRWGTWGGLGRRRDRGEMGDGESEGMMVV
jgi:hypothetical protein